MARLCATAATDQCVPLPRNDAPLPRARAAQRRRAPTLTHDDLPYMLQASVMAGYVPPAHRFRRLGRARLALKPRDPHRHRHTAATMAGQLIEPVSLHGLELEHCTAYCVLPGGHAATS